MKNIKYFLLMLVLFGISDSPNSATKTQFEKINNIWSSFLNSIASIDKLTIAFKNLLLLKEINKAIRLFEKPQ